MDRKEKIAYARINSLKRGAIEKAGDATLTDDNYGLCIGSPDLVKI